MMRERDAMPWEYPEEREQREQMEQLAYESARPASRMANQEADAMRSFREQFEDDYGCAESGSKACCPCFVSHYRMTERAVEHIEALEIAMRAALSFVQERHQSHDDGHAQMVVMAMRGALRDGPTFDEHVKEIERLKMCIREMQKAIPGGDIARCQDLADDLREIALRYGVAMEDD